MGDFATITYRMVATDSNSDVATYHVSGPTLEVSDSMIAVQKGVNRWEIACNRGHLRARVGENTTVAYKMIATNIAVVSANQ